MPVLKKVYVEITNVCNLRCDFCPPVERPRGFLSREDFRAILAKLSGKARILYFHIKGEPLLHPELGDFIDMAGLAGFAVHITTNGTLLAEKLGALRGRPALERVNISLHSLASLPESEREAAKRDILASAELLGREPSVKVVSLRQWDSSNADKNLVRLSPTISFHPAERFIWPHLPARTENRAATGTVETGDASTSTSAPGTSASGDVETSARDFGERGFCLALRDQAGILLDGTVVPCCLDAEGHIALGNIRDSAWDDIISSPRARDLYRGFSERRVVEALCRTCGFRTRFG